MRFSRGNLVVAGVISILSMYAPGVSGQTAAPQETVPVHAPGIHEGTFHRAGAPVVRYALSVPRGHDVSKPAPLVLALHFGGNPHGAALGLVKVLVAPGLADLNAVIVAPETLGRGWNTEENERAAIALLDAVEAAYRTDPRRVVVAGFSMGGAGTWHFARVFPDRFSAAIPLAGRPPADVSNWKMPVLAIHSRADEVVPFAPTEARIAQLRDAGVRAELITVNGITHYETARFAEPLKRAVSWLRDTWKKMETTR